MRENKSPLDRKEMIEMILQSMELENPLTAVERLGTIYGMPASYDGELVHLHSEGISLDPDAFRMMIQGVVERAGDEELAENFLLLQEHLRKQADENDL
jgi:hypothetical protein